MMRKPVWTVLMAGLLSASAWAQSQNVFITNSAANTVTVADSFTLTPLPNLPTGPNSIPVGATPTGCISDLSRNLVYVLNSGATPATVSVIDTQIFKVVNTITITSSGSVGGITMSQDNHFLYIAGRNTVAGEAGVFQIDLDFATAAGTTGTYVAGIASTGQAVDCEVLPASVVGGSGNGPGRLYFSETASNVIATINLLAGPPTAAALTMPTGIGTPSNPTLMTRSPDSTFILVGTANSGVFAVFQLFRINPAAAPQVDYVSVTGGSMGPSVEDVAFRTLDVAPPFSVYFLGNDIPGRSVNEVAIGPTGPPGAPAAVVVNTGYGLELTYDGQLGRLFVSGLGFTLPASYDVYNANTTPPSAENNFNSGGNNPRKFAFAPAPPPPVIDTVAEPAGINNVPFQLEIRGSGFLAGSSQARVQDNSLGVLTPATSTVVLNAGTILATFPGLLPEIFDVSVLNNDGNVSVLQNFFEGLPAAPLTPPFTVNLPPLSSGYSMLSYPQYATVGDLQAALNAQLGSYNPVTFRLFLWEQTRYVELNSPSLSPLESIMGRGFFALTRFGEPLTLSTPDVSGNTPAGQRVVVITPGWNIVSQPWINGVSNTMTYASLQVSSSPSLAPATGADVSPLVTNVLYEASGGSYVTGTTMTAGRAYWILNQTSGPLYLIFSRATVNKAAPASAPAAAATATPPPPPGSSLSDSGSGGGGGCGLLGGEALLVLLFLRGLGRRRLAA